MTSLFKLEDTVFQVSKEAKTIVPSIPLMKDELKLLSEVILCILSSQDKYEIALAATKNIAEQIIIEIPKTKAQAKSLKVKLFNVLNQPFTFSTNGKIYTRKIRFGSKKASYIISTIENIYLNSLTISRIIKQSKCSDDTRLNIINYCVGLGPKQASMFLRNIGYHSEFAVLDKHIIDYMQLMGLLDIPGYSSISSYKKIETRLRSYAETNNVSLLHLDLAIWTTMRVYKNY